MRPITTRPRARPSALALAITLTLTACRGEGEVLDLTAADDPASGTCPLVVLAAIDGLAVTPALTSDWDTGSCYELTLENTTPQDLPWWLHLTTDGATTDRWNHAARDLGGGLWEWTGVASSNNISLPAAATTTVGTCLAC